MIFKENDFPRTFPATGNPDVWLTSLKLDVNNSLEIRIMASEFLLIIQSIIGSNHDLPQNSKKILETLKEAIHEHQGS